jgi:hypothetical protein
MAVGVAEAASPYLEWQKRIKITLNTTQSGAYITKSVTNFPLLVRLTKVHFDSLNEAQSDGADIRFSDGAGKPLPYQIERWDSGKKLAEIWVLVPSILHNNQTQHIFMYWKKTGGDAKSESSPEKVFTVSNDFKGVYHLAETPQKSGTPGVFKDATGNAFHGTDSIQSGVAKPAMIGLGQSLVKSQEDQIFSTSFKRENYDELTVSCWVMPKNESYFHEGFLGHIEGNLQAGFGLGVDDKKKFKFGVRTPSNDKWFTAAIEVYEFNKWYHVTGTYDGDSAKIYVNGVQVGSKALNGTVATTATSRLTIGYVARYWDGAIDEARISTTARSKEWIALCYHNQKPLSDTANHLVDTLQMLDFGYPAIKNQPTSALFYEGQSATLKVVATSTVPLRYQWFKGADSLKDSVHYSGIRQETLTIRNVQLADSGDYSVVVSTDSGWVESAVARLSVADTTAPTPRPGLNFTFNPGVTRLRVSWDAPESPSPDLDSVFLCYSTKDTPPFSRTNCIALPALSIGRTRDTVITGLAPSTTYYFALFLRDSSGNHRQGANGAQITGQYGETTNPLTIDAQYVDSEHVAIELINFLDLPSWDYAKYPLFEASDSVFADTIGVWYSSSGAPPPDPKSKPQAKYSLHHLKQGSVDGYNTTLKVPKLVGMAEPTYYFWVSLRWVKPSATPAYLPFDPLRRDSALMVDTKSPANPLVLSGIYDAQSPFDSLTLTINSLDKVVAPNIDSIRIRLSLLPTFESSALLYSTTRPFRELQSQAVGGTLELGVKDARFTGLKKMVYADVVLISTAGVPSDTRDTIFIVGRPLPPNPLTLSIDTLSSSQVRLHLAHKTLNLLDSVRVVYDTKPIPQMVGLDEQTIGAMLGSVTVPGSQLSVAIDGLSPQSRYYFGALVLIDGLWSPVSADAAVDTLTNAPDPSRTMSNRAAIDTALFDGQRMQLGVVWDADTILDNVEYGISWGRDSLALFTTPPQGWHRALGRSDTSWLAVPPSAIEYEQRYFVAVWLRLVDGESSAPTGSGVYRFVVLPFSWQRVNYFAAFGRGDSVSVNNGAARLWYDGANGWVSGGGDMYDTIALVQLSSQELSGLIKVSGAYHFRQALPSQPFAVGLRLNPLPGGYSQEDVHLYRYSPSQSSWMVSHDDVVENDMVVVRTNHLDDYFVACIDTVKPQIQLVDKGDSIIENTGSNVQNQVRIVDNIVNPIVRFRVAEGGRSWGHVTLDTLSRADDILTLTVPYRFITVDNGVRIEVTASDGVSSTTLNVSRQVRRAAKTVSIDENRWVPLMTTQHSDTTAAAHIMRQLVDKSAADFSYDNRYARLFRWVGTADNATSPDKWVEYSEQNAALFSLEPGRLLWVKSRNAKRVDLGKGVTLSLKDTAVVRLVPTIGTNHGWTDFSVPFNFSMYVGDVTMRNVATGELVNNIQFYHWVADSISGRFSATSFYLPALQDKASDAQDSILKSEPRDLAAYCAYNPNLDTIELRFAPIPRELSARQLSRSGAGTLDKTPAASPSGRFIFEVIATNKSGSRIGPTILGYDPAPQSPTLAKTLYPLPPRFGGGGVELMVVQQQERGAHALAHHLDGFGGQLFELGVQNYGSAPETVRIGLQRLGSVAAAGMNVWLWDGSSQEALAVQSGSEGVELTIPAQSKKMLFVAVGRGDYFDRMRSKVAATNFALLSYGPSPFNSLVRVRYTLPLMGAARVQGALFDMRGRVVMSRSQQAAGLGEYVMELGEREGGSSTLASGMYVLRLWAVDEQGATIGSFERIITRLP